MLSKKLIVSTSGWGQKGEILLCVCALFTRSNAIDTVLLIKINDRSFAFVQIIRVYITSSGRAATTPPNNPLIQRGMSFSRCCVPQARNQLVGLLCLCDIIACIHTLLYVYVCVCVYGSYTYRLQHLTKRIEFHAHAMPGFTMLMSFSQRSNCVACIRFVNHTTTYAHCSYFCANMHCANTLVVSHSWLSLAAVFASCACVSRIILHCNFKD